MVRSWAALVPGFQLLSLQPHVDDEPNEMLLPLRRLATILWAAPYSCLGVTIGLLGLCTGGRMRVRRPVIEFYGGGVQWLIWRLPSGQFVMALTLGHTILGQTEASLDVSRPHELVHVRQFERWGPFLGPAYLLASLYLWLSGRDPYRDNPFERQAYAEAGDD